MPCLDKLDKDRTLRAFGEKLVDRSWCVRVLGAVALFPTRGRSRQVLDVKGWRGPGKGESCRN
jgi:hypothetical protein